MREKEAINRGRQKVNNPELLTNAAYRVAYYSFCSITKTSYSGFLQISKEPGYGVVPWLSQTTKNFL